MRIELGIPLTAVEIATWINGKKGVTRDRLITHLTTDSRTATSQDLFVALNGSKESGESYVYDAMSKGALVISTKILTEGIAVKDTSRALLDLSRAYLKKLPYLLYKVAITGSVGKTTTKEFTKTILSQKYKVHASPGNFNNMLGMPLSILSAPIDTQVLVLEMGMNHTGEISALSKNLNPDIGVITNIGTSHIGNLGSREMIARAKSEIAEGMTGGIILVPGEEELLTSVPYRMSVSIDNPKSEFYLENGKNDTLSFYLYGDLFSNVRFALKESHHKKALAFALSIAAILGLDEKDMRLGTSMISADNTRQKIVSRGGVLFLTDYYNSSPEAVSSCFEAARNIDYASRKSLLLGDILELGDMSKEIHYKIGKSIKGELFYNLFLFGKEASEIGRGALDAGFIADRIFINENTGDPKTTANEIKRRSIQNELIVMKASREVKLERVLHFFD